MDRVSPHGLESVAAAGNLADATKLPPAKDSVSVIVIESEASTFACKHTGPSRYTLDLYGEVTGEFVAGEENCLCSECMLVKAKEELIRCAACGLPIFPGQGVALYGKGSSLKYVAVGTGACNSWIGCLRWDCCPSGAFYAGVWQGPKRGFKSAFETVDGEALTCAEAVMATAIDEDRPKQPAPKPWYKRLFSWFRF